MNLSEIQDETFIKRELPPRFEADGSIDTSNLPTSPAISARRFTSTYSGFNQNLEETGIFNLPKRLFRWIYSFSLLLLISLMLGFVTITPIDVIIQTTGASSSGIKMFIVIIVCIVFLVVALIMYFSRIFQNRVALNDIPSKSVYIPSEEDIPKKTFEAIDKKFKECMEVRVKAGPLYNEDIIINHPGVSPPEYVQQRNISDSGEGSLLPPNACYEDVIRSLGDKFKINGRNITQTEVPKYYSFREIIIYLSEMYLIDNEAVKKNQVPNIKRLIELYENFKFGPDLIKEHELFEFIIEFDKLGQLFQSNYGASLTKTKRNLKSRERNDRDIELFEQSLSGSGYVSRPEGNYHNSDIYDVEDRHVNANTSSGESDNIIYTNFADIESLSSVVNPNLRKRRHTSSSAEESLVSWSASSLKRRSHRNNSKSSSSSSVIKNKLAISNSSKNSNSFEHLNQLEDTGSIQKKFSGYDTDSEEEYKYQDDQHQDDMGIYGFRTKNIPNFRAPSPGSKNSNELSSTTSSVDQESHTPMAYTPSTA